MLVTSGMGGIFPKESRWGRVTKVRMAGPDISRRSSDADRQFRAPGRGHGHHHARAVLLKPSGLSRPGNLNHVEESKYSRFSPRSLVLSGHRACGCFVTDHASGTWIARPGIRSGPVHHSDYLLGLNAPLYHGRHPGHGAGVSERRHGRRHSRVLSRHFPAGVPVAGQARQKLDPAATWYRLSCSPWPWVFLGRPAGLDRGFLPSAVRPSTGRKAGTVPGRVSDFIRPDGPDQPPGFLAARHPPAVARTGSGA